MGHRLDAQTRDWLLRMKLYPVPEGHSLDPYAPDYLYLAQQRKRLSLATSVGRLRPRNLPLLPLILAIVLVKTVDLWITNQMVRSLINERDLLLQGQAARKADD